MLSQLPALHECFRRLLLGVHRVRLPPLQRGRLFCDSFFMICVCSYILYRKGIFIAI
jgi:hypothetical protein